MYDTVPLCLAKGTGFRLLTVKFCVLIILKHCKSDLSGKMKLLIIRQLMKMSDRQLSINRWKALTVLTSDQSVSNEAHASLLCPKMYSIPVGLEQMKLHRGLCVDHA